MVVLLVIVNGVFESGLVCCEIAYLAVRMILVAISPRLAIKSFLRFSIFEERDERKVFH